MTTGSDRVRWGTHAPNSKSTVYVTNKGGFDVEDALAYAGAEARVPMVYLHEGSCSAGSLHATERSLEDKLRFFDPDSDVLMVAGRALVNLLVGSLMQGLFPGRRINLLTWDARSRSYELGHWDIGSYEETSEPQ